MLDDLTSRSAGLLLLIATEHLLELLFELI
jgi:hypothetical protein